ncbi:MAG: class I SAM-dependent methyltransferase [Rhodothermales bacterium]|nr:class I SAM-dependent methyltransferase [Rhodothermales bacterium]MBO6778026.1 class I SAM-dependent methyltransferase [Rhodothermales bacterium]
MAWYEQWFDTDEYELLYQNRNEDEARRLVSLIIDRTGVEAGSRVLDVGCGRGRHAVEFARRGFEVTGLDLSERSLEKAEQRAQEAGVQVRFLRGDMRKPVPEAFDLVVNLFTAFGYFEDDREHQAAIDAMAGSLDRDGWLVQDFLNAEYVRSHLVAADVRTVGQWEVRQSRRIQDGRIRKRIQFQTEEGSHAFEESVALLGRSDFERLYDAAGLEVVDVLGNYDGDPFAPGLPRLIHLAQRA